MVLAYVIYSLLLLLMVFSSKSYVRSRYRSKSIMYLSIIIFSLIVGLRYDVGVDHLAYINIFEHGNIGNDSIDRMEIIYQYINIILSDLGFHYSVLFTLTTALQLILLQKSLKFNKEILPWAYFFYFTTLYLFFALNGLRQAIAISILVYAFLFLYQRKVIPYLITVLVASGFHTSALIMLPAYFVAHKDILKSKLIQYIIYSIFFFFGLTFYDRILLLISSFAFGRYADFNLDILSNVSFANEDSLNIARFVWFLINLCVITLNDKLKYKYANCTPFLIFYNLYFVGICLDCIVGGTYFGRINEYFLNMRIFVYAYIAYYVYSNKKILPKLVTAGFCIFLIIFFYRAISVGAGKCAPYQFIWSAVS